MLPTILFNDSFQPAVFFRVLDAWKEWTSSDKPARSPWNETSAAKQAQAAAHRLKQDLAELQSRHWATCDANLESEFEVHFQDERIYAVLYFLLSVLQLQILAGWKFLQRRAPVQPGVVAAVDYTNIPDVYARLCKANDFLKDMPPVVIACYLLKRRLSRCQMRACSAVLTPPPKKGREKKRRKERNGWASLRLSF